MRRAIKKGLILILLIVLISGLAINGRADFGDFSGDFDYGSYDSGDSYDYSYDYGNDYSYDYSNGNDDSFILPVIIGGGNSNSSGGSGGSGGGFDLMDIVIFLIIAAVIVIFVRRKQGNAGTGAGKQRPVAPGAAPTTGLKPIETIKTWDPDFSGEEVKQRLSNLYVQMQNCWTDRDISPLRGDFTDEQFAQYDRQLQRYRTEGKTPMVERIAVMDVNFSGVKQDDTHDILVATLATRITTYVKNDSDGKIVSGDPKAEKFMRYEWTLIRPKGSKTLAQKADTAFNCPNCGAPMDINKSAKCSYCNSIVNRADYDWVISGIKGLSQRTS